MNTKVLLPIAVAVALTACSSTKTVTNGDEPIRNQKLSTSFPTDGIKIETNCAWYKPWKSAGDCEVTAVETTATAPTNGATVNNRRSALIHATQNAKANFVHFTNEKLDSTRVNTTIAKNIEKASDKLNSKGDDGKVVEMTDEEASKTHSVRENSNDTAHHLTTTVRTNASSMLRGFRTIKQDVVGDQEVSVTLRWDVTSDAVAQQLYTRFNGQSK